MLVDPSDLIGGHLYLRGDFEPSVVLALQRYAKPNDVLLDIGANIGYMSLTFLQAIRGSKTISVEPNPEVLPILAANLAQFGTDRYQIVAAAASDNDGTGYVRTLSPHNKGQTKLSNEGTEVRLISIRALWESLSEKPSILKIDVEGYEYKILASLIPALKTNKPRIIVYEDYTRASAPSGAIGSLLLPYYEIFALSNGLFNIRLLKVTSAADCTSCNYLALARNFPS